MSWDHDEKWGDYSQTSRSLVTVRTLGTPQDPEGRNKERNTDWSQEVNEGLDSFCTTDIEVDTPGNLCPLSIYKVKVCLLRTRPSTFCRTEERWTTVCRRRDESGGASPSSSRRPKGLTNCGTYYEEIPPRVVVFSCTLFCLIVVSLVSSSLPHCRLSSYYLR